MRAAPAAILAFLCALLAMPAPPVAAQCTLGEQEVALQPGPDAPAETTEAQPGETAAPGASGRHLSQMAEAFTAHVPAPLSPRSRPDPFRPVQARPPGATPLKSEEVVANLKARGFMDVSAVRQRGRSFLAEATGPRGERVRLVLDADSGEINGMQVIGFRPTAP